MAEHILYGKRKICYTDVTDFTDFQGIGRDPLYKRFDSVYSIIEKNIEPQYRDFLAHPIYCSEEDLILWHVREWNNTPSLYNDLPQVEKAKYTEIKDKTIAVYETTLKGLSGEDKQILTGALKYIDEDFMFCYDNKVIVIAWGMSPDTHKHVVKGTIIHDLQIQNNHKIRFIVGDNGSLSNKFESVISRPDGTILSHIDLPNVTPKEGYIFNGWEPNPLGLKVNGPLTFNAIYDKLPIENTSIEKENVNVNFIAGDGGSLSGITEFSIEKGTYIDTAKIPEVLPFEGYTFSGWDVQPDLKMIDKDTTFCAIFNRNNINCKFNAGEHGTINGSDYFSLPYGSSFNHSNIPDIKAKRGYKFIGWDKSPIDFVLNNDTTFTAQYQKKLPWYKRIWAWFNSFNRKGCLKWILWILLFLLLLFLLSLLPRGCRSGNNTVKPIEKIKTTNGKEIDNNGPIKGIVDDEGKLPINNVVAPIVGNDGIDPPIISNPGTPDIVANRLNIYFENANVNLEQFVSDLSKIYSENECQVIGFDKNIPMIQILIPENMRDIIRESLNTKLPNYEFFVVDESIFTIIGNNSIDTANLGWHLEAIDLEEGWKITKGSSNITVAVVDDGIDATHEILKGRIVNPYNVFTQDNKLSVGQGHGTHVAGLAVGSDKMLNKRISGIAPECKLMPIQVFDNGFCTFSSITSGIMYAIHHGANVVNVSIGPNFKGLDILPIPDQEYIGRTQFKNEERVWKRIINVANEHNVIIVFAVGNNNILANIPPENRTNMTLNVAAVDRNIKGTDFTNYGIGSNISAPGKGILSSVPVDEYAVFDGTSMAAPIVSGTVALMKSLKPEISVSDILHILQATGQIVSDYIPPMIQVDDALMALKTGVIPKKKDNNMNNHPNPNKSNENANSKETLPISEKKSDGTDYNAIRELIESYKQKINELEKLLPENKQNK